MGKTYLYMRISRDKIDKKKQKTLERNKSLNIDTNFSRQEYLFKDKGYDIADPKFEVVREVTSGNTLFLPQLESLIEKMEYGDTLVVPELQRLVRNIYYGFGIIYRLQEIGANLISLDGSFNELTNLDNPSDFLNISIRMVLDQYQALDLKKKQRDTIRALKEKGVKIGRPQKKDSLNELILKEYELNGYKIDIEKIANENNITKGSIYNRLKSNGIDVKKERQEEETKIVLEFLNLENKEIACAYVCEKYNICDRELKKYIRNYKNREKTQEIQDILRGA